MKHDLQATANATAATIAFLYIFCALAVILFPVASLTVARSWFHGIDLNPISAAARSPGSLLLGLVTSTAGGWLLGYVFATAYNSFLKK